MKKIICIFLLLKYIDATVRVDPLVDTPKGLMKGVSVENYAMFLGVPYGVVDEENPFGDALPHPGFSTTFEAYENKISCPQDNNRSNYEQSIQCLLLDIYVPNTASSSNKLPVMVFVHGGGFGGGSGVGYNPEMLLKHDVIVVTLNYRLGPYGFLCLSIPGYNNQGMKDQLLAFNWIKDNIKYFGGDEENMTVFGQSAGAMSIDIHLHAYEAGLFKRAILQSGSALTPFCTAEVNDTVPINMARNLGFDIDNVKDAMAILKCFDFKEILEVANEIGLSGTDHPILKPCAEYVEDTNRFLLDHPENLKPRVKNMDILIGHTNKEQNMYGSRNLEKYDFDYEVKRGFNGDIDTELVKHFYIGGKNVNDSSSEIIDFASDFAFFYPAERSYERYIKENANSVYRYVFAHKAAESFGPRSETDGVGHGGDMPFIFSEGLAMSEEDVQMAELMTLMWTNFAKYGNPTPPSSDITPTWPAASGDERPYLHIKFPLAVEYRAFHTRMSFWDVYYKLYATQVKGYKANGE